MNKNKNQSDNYVSLSAIREAIGDDEKYDKLLSYLQGTIVYFPHNRYLIKLKKALELFKKNYSTKEISKILGCTEKNIKQIKQNHYKEK